MSKRMTEERLGTIEYDNSYCADELLAELKAERKRNEALEGDVVSLQLMEKSLIQYCKDHKAHIKALQAKLDAIKSIRPDEFADPYDYEIMMEALQE